MYHRNLSKAIEHFCVQRNTLPQGIYNIVNNGIVTGEQVVKWLKEGGMANTRWKVVPIEDLDLKAARSNCTLSGGKLKTKGGFDMPNVVDSLKHCISRLNERTLCQVTEKV